MHAMHLHPNFAGIPHQQLKNYRKFLSISLPYGMTHFYEFIVHSFIVPRVLQDSF